MLWEHVPILPYISVGNGVAKIAEIDEEILPLVLPVERGKNRSRDSGLSQSEKTLHV